MGRLTTHILDTANGTPAAGVHIRLYTLGDVRQLTAEATTNADGRTDKPLVADADFKSGTYELEFDIGAYFAGLGVAGGKPRFLDTVVIRFAVDAAEHYHVPLLASPWSYSTYRGS
ncbi:MAG: hydroxyisourate hydrolase [Woeseiaceae bacterium]|nr:hydroxyisourate hydrolase [Woeseiaceae bacterium]